MRKTILITGGTGLIGSALVKTLHARGDSVLLLTRDIPAALKLFNEVSQLVSWHGDKASHLASRIDGVDAVIHLAASSVGAKRWNDEYKKQILESRVTTTRMLSEAIVSVPNPPSCFLSMSGIGYYGDRGADPVDESAPSGTDFLARVCVAWEAEALRANDVTRVVIPRAAVVLSRTGGALPRLLLPFRLFAGGPIGDGRQYFPWVHIDDVIAFILRAIDDSSLTGAYNLCAPDIVTNKEFCAALGRRLRRPSWLAVPAPALRLVVGEFAETLLTGQRAAPRRLMDAGHEFIYSSLDSALRQLFPRRAEAVEMKP